MAKKKLKSRTITLLHRWVRRREKQMSPRCAWPAAECLTVKEGVAYRQVLSQFSIIPTTVKRDLVDVDVMGEAFWALGKDHPWKCEVLWRWARTGESPKELDMWMEFQKSVGLSERKLDGILLDLQEEAEKRGIV